MRFQKANLTADKGWFAGPWNSDLSIAIGYAGKGVDEPHVHSLISEIYLVARGCSDIRVEKETLTLSAGDMLILAPGEAHTFLSSSPDYLHFVIQAPGLAGDTAQAEKSAVPRTRLGL
jgi:mannose-6-phosphate isomerase-like protein (cupin superfamily)